MNAKRHKERRKIKRAVREYWIGMQTLRNDYGGVTMRNRAGHFVITLSESTKDGWESISEIDQLYEGEIGYFHGFKILSAQG